MDERAVQTVLEAVANNLEPKGEDVRKVQQVERLVLTKLKAIASDFTPELEGSVAKGTWLPDSPELDVFLLFPTQLPKVTLEKRVMEIGGRVFKKMEVRYAEHPYVRGIVRGIPVDLVPCYRVDSPAEMISAVDRTPFHTRFINEHLTSEQKRDVRLLKAFFKGIGVYGAEIRTRGFSGYASEVLIYRFGSFLNLLREASRWKGKVNLGWSGEPEALGLPDPVDPARNVTASVSMRNLSTFVAASGLFLYHPSEVFFETRAEGVENAKEVGLGQVLAIKTGRPKAVDDVLWGGMWRALSGIRRYLENNGFVVYDGSAYADSAGAYFLLFLGDQMRHPATLLYGPPVNMVENSVDFIRKWKGEPSVLRGPWVEGNRWVVVRKTEGSSVDVLRRGLSMELQNMGLGEFEDQFKRGYEVRAGKEVLSLSRKDEFKREVRRFASYAPHWLDALRAVGLWRGSALASYGTAWIWAEDEVEVQNRYIARPLNTRACSLTRQDVGGNDPRS